jgi:hypothetical protein
MKATFIVLLIDTATSATVNADGAGAGAGAGDGEGVTTAEGLDAFPPPHAMVPAVMTMTASRVVKTEIEAVAMKVPHAKLPRRETRRIRMAPI